MICWIWREKLGDPTAVVVIDETGFMKKGTKSVGVVPQYSETAGKIGNCPIGVFMAYASRKGHILMDRELYQASVSGPTMRRVVKKQAFQRRATKLVLARRMLERALIHGLPFPWVTGDSVYGADYGLHHFSRGKTH